MIAGTGVDAKFLNFTVGIYSASTGEHHICGDIVTELRSPTGNSTIDVSHRSSVYCGRTGSVVTLTAAPFTSNRAPQISVEEKMVTLTSRRPWSCLTVLGLIRSRVLPLIRSRGFVALTRARGGRTSRVRMLCTWTQLTPPSPCYTPDSFCEDGTIDDGMDLYVMNGSMPLFTSMRHGEVRCFDVMTNMSDVVTCNEGETFAVSLWLTQQPLFDVNVITWASNPGLVEPVPVVPGGEHASATLTFTPSAGTKLRRRFDVEMRA